jgi:spore maturation protein CgeB
MKNKILFVHPLIGNAYELYKAFQRNSNVEIFPLIEKEKKFNIKDKILFKLKLPPDIYDVNNKLLKYYLNNIDIIFIIKGNEIYPKTLKKIKELYPHIKLINWSLDDMFAWHNRSLYYTFGIKYYDHVFTTKSYNLEELPLLGAKKVHFLTQAYSKDIHKPCFECIDNPVYDVLFIGYPEKERFESLQYLAKNGIKIDIFGYPDKWIKFPFKNHHKNLIIHNRFLEGKEYAKAISSSKITLCFLRKANRDLHTSRSVEIPACGGFMLAERTKEHKLLFEENKEAVYFSNNEELLEKVKFYLKNEKERKKIAQNGLRRTIESDYSYDNMVNKILKVINES